VPARRGTMEPELANIVFLRLSHVLHASKEKPLLRRGFRVGDYAEVRPLGEVLATLDADGSLDGMPFMPEMIRCCGRRYRVVKSAHKTCDPTGLTNLRRVKDAIHLEARCDGSGHDGCQAGCLIFWHKKWLRPADGPSPTHIAATTPADLASRVEALHRATHAPSPVAGEIRYRCQATELNRFSTPLSQYEPTQYLTDLLSGNVAFGEFVRRFASSVVKGFVRTILGAGGTKAVKQSLRRLSPAMETTEDARSEVPANPELGLQEGELVRVRSTGAIKSTLDDKSQNRGLSFDDDMAQRAGGVFRVATRVQRVIDERTGKMLRIRKDCLILDGVSCIGNYNRNRLFCPRGALQFWRESWLERVQDVDAPQAEYVRAAESDSATSMGVQKS
jgi:hypothetical protein